MMKISNVVRFLVVSFLLLGLGNSFALESLILYQAEPGDKYSLKIINEKVKYRNNQKIQGMKGETDVDVRINEIIDDKYDLCGNTAGQS